MLSDIQRPVSASVVKSIWRSVLAGNAGPVDPIFPEKGFYFTDFAGVANATTLRSLSGWSAYNSASSVSARRDQWVVQSEHVTRTATSQDFDVAPGLFVVGRPALSTDHIFKTKLVTIPDNGNAIFVVVAATAQNNAVIFECTNSSGLMQNFVLSKNVNGTRTQLFTLAGASSTLGRRLQAGDEIELHVIGQRVHLFVNGYRITAVAGVDLDTGGAYTKGDVCGFGTGQGVGAVFDDIYIAGIVASMSVSATPIFWPGSLAQAGRSVTLSGTYTGDVQALDYRVVNSVTGTTVKDWARIQSPTIALGSWAATAFVPMSSNSTNPKVRIQVRPANEVDARVLSTETAVGICVGSYGQSNSFYRGQGSATSHSVSNAYTFAQDSGSEWQGGASTTVVRSQLWATKLSEVIGIPCGIFIAGSGSKTLLELSTRGAGMLDEMEALCAQANAFGFVSSWLWTQGEAEASAAAPYDETAYRSQFDVLMSELRTGASGGFAATFGICTIGHTSGGHISGTTFGDANWSAVRAGSSRLVDKPGVFMATHLTDAILADSLHYTANSYVENGRRAGLSMRKALGYGVYDGRGPLVTGATRSGAVVMLAIDLNGAASIAGTGLTHYQVSADNFATLLTVSSAVVSGGNITLTLSADPAAAVKVRSFYGMDWTTPVRAIGTYADGTTIPVEPIFTAITSN